MTLTSATASESAGCHVTEVAQHGFETFIQGIFFLPTAMNRLISVPPKKMSFKAVAHSNVLRPVETWKKICNEKIQSENVIKSNYY